MTTINCCDRCLEESELSAFGNALIVVDAKLQTPLNCSQPVKSVRTGLVHVLILDPVVEFDQTKVSRATVIGLINQYGFVERP